MSSSRHNADEVISDEQRNHYQEHGYLIVDTGIPAEVLDAAIEDLAPLWKAPRWRQFASNLWFAQENRIQDAWLLSEPARRIATFPAVLQMLEALYDRQPLGLQTLTFPRGTQQKPHADSIHFNSEPFGLMCGVWVALEDIGPTQGPLVFYPGSHRLPEMNFEDIGLAPSYKNYASYETYIESLIEEHGFEPAYGTIKKGQAIIWAANLLHGGATQTDPAASRHSQVSHYFFAGCKYWRPGFSSAKKRRYYRPSWIPSRTIPPWQRPLAGFKHRFAELMMRVL